MPIVRKQAKRLPAAPRVHGERFHYFETGIKKLIIELKLENVAVFPRTCRSSSVRHDQLRHLHQLVRKQSKP